MRVEQQPAVYTEGQITETLEKKYQRLRETLVSLESVLVAFSGGVDSTLLLRVAWDALPGRVLAVYADSPLNPAREHEAARQSAADLGVPFQVVRFDLEDPHLVKNDRDRCYWCKHGIFTRLAEIALKSGVHQVIEGSNVDDLADFRPGRRALQELNVISPLLEADLSKEEIRRLSRFLGLYTWDKPAQACLASRVPYGTAITLELLDQIDRAEEVLREAGFHRFRVRHHGEVARIELDPKDFEQVLGQGLRATLVDGVRRAGYQYVSLDLAGYRTGSMNEPYGRGCPQETGL